MGEVDVVQALNELTHEVEELVSQFEEDTDIELSEIKFIRADFLSSLIGDNSVSRYVGSARDFLGSCKISCSGRLKRQLDFVHLDTNLNNEETSNIE